VCCASFIGDGRNALLLLSPSIGRCPATHGAADRSEKEESTDSKKKKRKRKFKANKRKTNEERGDGGGWKVKMGHVSASLHVAYSSRRVD